MMYEYKVIIYKEGFAATRMFGNAAVKADKFAKMLNKEATQGWKVITIAKEHRRTLMSSREALVVVMERQISM